MISFRLLFQHLFDQINKYQYKSSKYGFSFDNNETIIPERYTVWMLLAALASLVAWLTGAAAE